MASDEESLQGGLQSKALSRDWECQRKRQTRAKNKKKQRPEPSLSQTSSSNMYEKAVDAKQKNEYNTLLNYLG